MKIILFLLLVTSISRVTWSSNDKEFEAILSNIENGVDRSFIIKSLKTYNSRNKRNQQSHMLLAHLYSLEKDWSKAINTYFVIPTENRDANFWLAVLLPMSEDLSLLDKPEHKEKPALLLEGVKEHVRMYDKKDQQMMTKILSHLKDKNLNLKFCADLLTKNSQKCQIR